MFGTRINPRCVAKPILLVASVVLLWFSGAVYGVIHSGNLSQDETWTNNDVHIVTGTFLVESGVTLTISSGTTVKFESNARLEVYGALDVQGAAGSEVVFTSSEAMPAAGDWSGIWIRSGASTVTIDHALIEYANYGLFFSRSGSVGVVTNSAIRNNSRGIYLGGNTLVAVENALPVITGNSLYGNAFNVYAGNYFDHENVRVDVSGNWWGSADPLVIEQGIYDYIDNTSYSPTVALDSYLDGPGGNAVAGLSGSYGSDTTLSPMTVYTVLGRITVQPGATLAIPSGVELRFPKQQGWRLEVFGSLTVQGTAANQVVFTSSEPAAGGWGGIWIRSGASTVTIDHALIEYANYGLWFNRSGSVGVVTNSAIRNNSRGIYLGGNTLVAVENPLPVITGNSLYGNTQNVYARNYFDHENVRVDAIGNWWGSADPLVIEQGIYHYIDNPSSSPTVDFSRYLGGQEGPAVLISTNYRIQGYHLNNSAGIGLVSTASQPVIGSTSTTVGQSEALGISTSTQTLSASAPGFWPIVAGVSPPLIDTDGDGTPDDLDDDDDNDGLTDVIENILGTNPFLPDTDGDSLTDYFETAFGGLPEQYTPGEDLNPLSPDTDGDGFADDVEISFDSNPLSQLETPANGDINEDGVVNAADILLATQIALNLRIPTPAQAIRADVAPRVNGIPVPDGVINAADVMLLQSIALTANTP